MKNKLKLVLCISAFVFLAVPVFIFAAPMQSRDDVCTEVSDCCSSIPLFVSNEAIEFNATYFPDIEIVSMECCIKGCYECLQPNSFGHDNYIRGIFDWGDIFIYVGDADITPFEEGYIRDLSRVLKITDRTIMYNISFYDDGIDFRWGAFYAPDGTQIEADERAVASLDSLLDAIIRSNARTNEVLVFVNSLGITANSGCVCLFTEFSRIFMHVGFTDMRCNVRFYEETLRCVNCYITRTYTLATGGRYHNMQRSDGICVSICMHGCGWWRPVECLWGGPIQVIENVNRFCGQICTNCPNMRQVNCRPSTLVPIGGSCARRCTQCGITHTVNCSLSGFYESVASGLCGQRCNICRSVASARPCALGSVQNINGACRRRCSRCNGTVTAPCTPSSSYESVAAGICGRRCTVCWTINASACAWGPIQNINGRCSQRCGRCSQTRTASCSFGWVNGHWQCRICTATVASDPVEYELSDLAEVE